MAVADEKPQLDRRFAVSTLLSPRAAGLGLVRDTSRFATGMDPLDRTLGGGFAVHDLVLVGGRPGVGKTIAATQWAREVARSGAKAVLVTFEHDESQLLGRLVALEMGMLDVDLEDSTRAALVRGVLNGEFAPGSDIGRHPLVRAAVSQIEMYADNMLLLPASRLRMNLDHLEEMFADLAGERKVLFVDYVQKVPIAGRSTSWDSAGARIVAERLKEMTLSADTAVVAIAAVDQEGLRSRRARVEHLRSAAAVSYEADVAIMINDKSMATSRVHLSFDATKAKEFARMAVFSIEKNRSGRSDIDLEFEKDFRMFRFLPVGGYVAETLIDGITGPE